MKKALVSLFSVVLFGGCASTAAVSAGNDSLRELRSENDTLVRILVLNKLAERQREFGLTSPATGALAGQPTVRIALQPFPKNLAKTDKAAGGCESGPEAVEILNDSIFFLKFTVDGQSVTVLGNASSSEIVAPRQKIYLCLGAGEHVIAGTAFVAKDVILPRAGNVAPTGEIVELGKLEKRLTIGSAGAAAWAVNTRDVILPAALR